MKNLSTTYDSGAACTCTTHNHTEQQLPTPQPPRSCCEGSCASKPRPPQTHLLPSQRVIDHIFYLSGRCGVPGPGESQELLADTISWLYRDLAPVGAMQTLLASQVISAYLVIQTQLLQSSKETFLDQANMRINMASKLMRALNVQINLLATLKGMKVQSVKVEHLNVTGNSVIGIGGHVEQGGGHRG